MHKLSHPSHSSWRAVTKNGSQVAYYVASETNRSRGHYRSQPPKAVTKEWEEKEFLDQWRFQNWLLLFANLATLNFHTLPSIPFSRHTYFLPFLKALPALKTLWPCLANRPMNEKIYWDRRGYQLWGKLRNSVKSKISDNFKLELGLQELFPLKHV